METSSADNDRSDTESNNKLSVVLMHNKFRKRQNDHFMLDIANALKDHGHNVTLYTTEIDPQTGFDELSAKGSLKVKCSGWWLPRKQYFLSAIWMALNLAIFGPSIKPTIVIMDVNTVALFLLSMFTNYKLIYISHFTSLQNLNQYTKSMRITPDLISAKALKRADDIVVPSECLADIFKRSFPNVKKDITILHPCVDTGYWNEESIEISRIIPDIPKPNYLFVCFGSYVKRSNFKVVLEAFEHLLSIAAKNVKNDLHLAIAGHCSETNIDQKIYYNELLQYTKDKSIASQVTFLKQLPTIHKKSLIEESIGVILPGKHELYAETILAVLAGGRPIVATNTGFAKETLRHRITAILIEPNPQLFAAAMYKILTNPAIQIFLSQMGNDLFRKSYSFSVFRRKVNSMVERCVEPPSIMNCI